MYTHIIQLLFNSGKTCGTIIEAIDQIFSLFGLPHHMITDNSRQFCSTEFEDQLREWNINHKRKVPYTPRLNPVEWFHKTLKKHRSQSSSSRVDQALREALRTIRSTKNTATGRSPGDVLLCLGYQTVLPELQAHQREAEETDEELDDVI